MEARPILLIREPVAEGLTLDNQTLSMLNRAGYSVFRVPPEAMDGFKVLAPCPFAAADVEFLRGIKGKMVEYDDECVLGSIINRMEDMVS